MGSKKELTPRMVRAFARAHLIADEHGHSFVGTEHVLIALAEDDHGIARRVLDDLDVTAEVKNRCAAWMDSDDYRSRLRKS
jgi:ATP-dependent Clp protease ATP-binding subunit ClpA